MFTRDASSDCDNGSPFDSIDNTSMSGFSRITTSDQRSSNTQSDMSCFIVDVGLFGNTGLRCFWVRSLESSVSSLDN
jgi:hypothetical protein